MTTLTPGDVAGHLKVSGATVRRMASAYEKIFGPLARDGKQHRVWSLEAVRRVQVAHEALNTGQVTSLENALILVRDGDALPVRAELPVRSDALAELLTEVRALRTLAEVQGRELTALRAEMAGRQVLPALEPAGAELLAEVQALREAVTAQGEREVERYRLTAHVAPLGDQDGRRQRGVRSWLASLFGSRL